jgi:CheY-like chemotaxis protein
MSENSIRPTVLIVDDYPDVRPLLRRWLEDFGCRVVEAADGREAVSVAKRERPELILMDLFMPEVDGFAAALRLRKDPELNDVPIVAISAYGELGLDEQLKIDPQAVGFNDYVQKPFGPEKLKEFLERFVFNNRDTGRNSETK